MNIALEAQAASSTGNAATANPSVATAPPERLGKQAGTGVKAKPDKKTRQQAVRFKCDTCTRSYTRQCDLTKHINNKHPSRGTSDESTRIVTPTRSHPLGVPRRTVMSMTNGGWNAQTVPNAKESHDNLTDFLSKSTGCPFVAFPPRNRTLRVVSNGTVENQRG